MVGFMAQSFIRVTVMHEDKSTQNVLLPMSRILKIEEIEENRMLHNVPRCKVHFKDSNEVVKKIEVIQNFDYFEKVILTE